jgi:death-on-curing protein
LVDGNKRAAWHLTYVFCGINGVEIAVTEDEAFDLVMDVAAGLDALTVIAERLLPDLFT